MRISIRPGDTGAPDPNVAALLDAFRKGECGEHAVLAAIADSRLLVPVVAMLAEANEDGTEKETEMAIPTLVGNDGRTAVLSFTSLDTLKRWRPDARPVPHPATKVWEAAMAADGVAAIDIAGPVTLIIEGARMRALANDEPLPPPHEDPDIRDAIAEIAARDERITGFTLEPGSPGRDLAVRLRGEPLDHESLNQLGAALARALGARLRRGIEIQTPLSRTNCRVSLPSGRLPLRGS